MASAGIEATIAGKTVSLFVVDPHYDIENNAESLAEFKKSLKVVKRWFELFNSDSCVRTPSHECVILNLDSYFR